MVCSGKSLLIPKSRSTVFIVALENKVEGVVLIIELHENKSTVGDKTQGIRARIGEVKSPS